MGKKIIFNNKEVRQVSDFLQEYISDKSLDYITPDKPAAQILADAGILEQIPPQPAFHLREMLRQGKKGIIDLVEGATQETNGRWKIHPSVFIRTTFENCSYETPYMFEADSISKISFRFEANHFPNRQSTNEKKKRIKRAIQAELSKIKWIIYGDVNLDFTWYFSGLNRKHTSQEGDLDNLTKFLIDELSGSTKILVNDSQITSFHSMWLSKDETHTNDVLNLTIAFDNDDCTYKSDLKFFEITKSQYAILNQAINEKEDLLKIKVLIHLMRSKCTFLKSEAGTNPNHGLGLTNQCTFHKGRLDKIDPVLLFDKSRLSKLYIDMGLSCRDVLRFGRENL